MLMPAVVPMVLLMWVAMFALPTVWIRATVLVFASGVLTLVALVVESRWRTRRLIRTDPAASRTYLLDLSDDSVMVSSDHFRSEITWNGIFRVVETPEFYIFFSGLFAAQHLPKRAMADGSGSERELRELIRRRSPDRGVNLLPDAG